VGRTAKGYCKACDREAGRARYAATDPELRSQENRKRQGADSYRSWKRQWEQEPENVAKKRDRTLRRKYGISAEGYAALLEGQGGRCALCGGDDPKSGNRFGEKWWHVDHDHQTGRVRGLLCGPCNMALGLFKDDPEFLRLAIEYLTEFSYPK